MSKKKPGADEKNFQDTLESLDRGKVLQRLTKQLAKVVQASMETQRKGVLQFKLTVTPQDSMVTLAAEIKTTIPQEHNEPTAFLADEDGALTPQQMDFGPTIVSRDAGRPAGN